MTIIEQPWADNGRRLGDLLVQLLIDPLEDFKIFTACVAYVKSSGILRLVPAIKAFLDRGGDLAPSK